MPDDRRRDKHVPIVMTSAEYNLVKRAAEEVGLTVSTFGREVMLAASQKNRNAGARDGREQYEYLWRSSFQNLEG